MGKALILWGFPDDATSPTVYHPVTGGSAPANTESNSHITMPFAGTFSKLGFNLRGGSGTRSLTFRPNSAAGNQVASASATGWAEDSSNSDTIAANDEVAIERTAGTTPNYAQVRLVWQAAGSHCSFHFAVVPANGVVCDATNDRFQSFDGSMPTDWNTSEPNDRQKIRSAGVASHFQINVTANAGASSRTFHVRNGGSSVNGIITVTAGATGIFVDTSNTDTLVVDDLVGAYMTPLTATDDITLRSCGIFITNTVAHESNVFRGNSQTNGGLTRSSSATANYIGLGGVDNALTTATAGSQRFVRPGFGGVISKLSVRLSANNMNLDGTFKLMNITQGTQILITLTGGGGVNWYDNTTDTLTFSANDELVYEIDEGGVSGSITLRRIAFACLDTDTPAPSAGGTSGLLQLMGFG